MKNKVLVLLSFICFLSCGKSPEQCMEDSISKLKKSYDFTYLKSLDRFTDFMFVMKSKEYNSIPYIKFLTVKNYLNENYMSAQAKEQIFFTFSKEEEFWEDIYEVVSEFTDLMIYDKDDINTMTPVERADFKSQIIKARFQINKVLGNYSKEISPHVDRELRNYFKSFSCLKSFWTEVQISEEEKFDSFRDVLSDLIRFYNTSMKSMVDCLDSPCSDEDITYRRLKLDALEESLKRIDAAFIYKVSIGAKDSEEWNSEFIYDIFYF